MKTVARGVGVLLQELAMPFNKWLDKHKLHLIRPLFYETQTSQGYGYLDEVPTYYGVSPIRPRPNPPHPTGLGHPY